MTPHQHVQEMGRALREAGVWYAAGADYLYIKAGDGPEVWFIVHCPESGPTDEHMWDVFLEPDNTWCGPYDCQVSDELMTRDEVIEHAGGVIR